MIKSLLRSQLAYRVKESIINSKYIFIYRRENTLEKITILKNITFFKIKKNNSDSKNILVQQLDSYELTLKIASAVKAYSMFDSIKVYCYEPKFNKKLNWINKDEQMYFLFFKTFTQRVYKALGYNFLFDLDQKFSNRIKIEKKFKEISGLIRTKDDVLKITIDNILVGDLIYDTYLRFYGNHTVSNINDQNLKDVIYYAIDNYYLVEKYIEQKSISALFTSYTTYINHGLAVRICLNKNIPIYTFGSNSYFIQRLDTNYPYHIQKYWNFSNLELSEKQKNEVERELNFRFSGGIDSAISYMKTTSFAPRSNKNNYFHEKRERNVVVYVHDIYDSPHGVKKLLFTDFYSYIVELSEQIRFDETTQYFFKFHPNAIGDSNQKITDYLLSLQSDAISLLPLEVSNLDVVAFNPDLIVTVNGTVGVEMAYFQIPVVALIDNLYMNFSFVHSCYSLQEYLNVIKGIVKVNVNFDLLEIYSFYYQAYKKELEGIDKSILEILSIQHDTSSDNYLKKVNENFNFSLFEKLILLLQSKFNK
jgi:hypothetical protein